MMESKSTFGFGGWSLSGEAVGLFRSVMNFIRGSVICAELRLVLRFLAFGRIYFGHRHDSSKRC